MGADLRDPSTERTTTALVPTTKVVTLTTQAYDITNNDRFSFSNKVNCAKDPTSSFACSLTGPSSDDIPSVCELTEWIDRKD